jgi:hypothetical protein
MPAIRMTRPLRTNTQTTAMRLTHACHEHNALYVVHKTVYQTAHKLVYKSVQSILYNVIKNKFSSAIMGKKRDEQ